MTPDDLTIRMASSDNLYLVLQLNTKEYTRNTPYWSSLTQFEKFEAAGWWTDHSLLEWYQKILGLCDGGILLLFANNNLVGELDYVVSYDSHGNVTEKRSHIIWLLVDEPYRNKGYAKYLINHLVSILPHPIWVEAEDSRSNSLYQKIGEQVHSICNWTVDVSLSVTSDRFHETPISYQELHQKISDGWSPIIGRYYAPCYDVSYLRESDEVNSFVWGNTPKVDPVNVSVNGTDIIVIITQYLRIYVPQDFDIGNLLSILDYCSAKLLDIGFSEVYLQCYHTPQLHEIITGRGAMCTSEGDPVYRISSSEV